MLNSSPFGNDLLNCIIVATTVCISLAKLSTIFINCNIINIGQIMNWIIISWSYPIFHVMLVSIYNFCNSTNLCKSNSKIQMTCLSYESWATRTYYHNFRPGTDRTKNNFIRTHVCQVWEKKTGKLAEIMALPRFLSEQY